MIFYFRTLKKYILLILVFYLSGCAPSKETRYEQKPNEEKSEIKPTILLKTMETREREFIKEKKILSVDRISFGYDSNGKLTNKGKISTAKYDQKGFLTETMIFDERGRAQNRYEYKYDNKGFRIESLRFDAQNKLDKKYTYSYDKLGNKIKSTRFNLESKAEKYYEYQYNSDLNLISDEWYNISGELEYKIETEYEGGFKSVSFSYNNRNLEYKYIFKYDDKKNLIEEQKFNNTGKLVGIIQYLYKYYQ